MADKDWEAAVRTVMDKLVGGNNKTSQFCWATRVSTCSLLTIRAVSPNLTAPAAAAVDGADEEGSVLVFSVLDRDVSGTPAKPKILSYRMNKERMLDLWSGAGLGIQSVLGYAGIMANALIKGVSPFTLQHVCQTGSTNDPNKDSKLLILRRSKHDEDDDSDNDDTTASVELIIKHQLAGGAFTLESALKLIMEEESPSWIASDGFMQLALALASPDERTEMRTQASKEARLASAQGEGEEEEEEEAGRMGRMDDAIRAAESAISAGSCAGGVSRSGSVVRGTQAIESSQIGSRKGKRTMTEAEQRARGIRRRRR